jgi:ribosome biogenesis GTPase A
MKSGKAKKKNKDQREDVPLVRKIPMRTLEILIIGAPNSGKSSLAKSLLGETNIETQSYGIGMTLHKATINLPSGETVMIYLWDAKTSLTFKEAH